MQRLLNPVEDMAKALWTPIKLADRTTVNRALGTVTIAEGTQITVNDGYILTVRKGGVECRRADEYALYDKKAYEKAQGLADSFAVLRAAHRRPSLFPGKDMKNGPIMSQLS